MIRERTAHINRIKALLFGQGIRGINVKSRYKTLKSSELVTGDGRPLPERLGREIERLAQVQAQIVAVERERDRPVTTNLRGDGTQASRSVAPQGARLVLILNPHPGGLLPPVRQSTAGGQLYRDCAQYL